MNTRMSPMVLPLVGLAPICRPITNILGSNQAVNSTCIPMHSKISVLDTEGCLYYQGTTPTTIPTKKTDFPFSTEQYRIVFNAQDRKRGIWLSSSPDSGWYLRGNIIGAGFIGMLIIDPLSGAMWTLEPSAEQCGALKVVLAYRISHQLFEAAKQISEGRM